MAGFGVGTLAAGQKLVGFGSRLQWVGRQLQNNITLPLAVAGGAAVKFALDNQKAFVRVVKVYGDGTHSIQDYRKELEALQRNFVALSNYYGVAQKDVINIAADWAAAGASGAALAKSTELTLKTMVLGELDAAKATQALISIQAQYGMTTGTLTKTINQFNMVENQTGISMAGLIDGFQRVAGTARSSGVPIRQLMAMLAAMTPAAGSAAQAGNALKTIFSRLMSPTKDAVQVLNLMGINISDLDWKSKNAGDRLIILAHRFQNLSSAQKGVVSATVASRWQINKFDVLMRELINKNGYYAKALKATSDRTRVYAQAQFELNQVLTSSPHRLQQMWVILQNAMADIIQPLIPLLIGVAQKIASMATAFSHLDPNIQKLVLLAAVILALIGPVLKLVGALKILGGLFLETAGFAMKSMAFVGRAFLLPIAPMLKFLFMSKAVRAEANTPWFLTLLKVPFNAIATAFGAIPRAAALALAALKIEISAMRFVIMGLITVFPLVAAGAARGWALVSRVTQASLVAMSSIAGDIWRYMSRIVETSLIAAAGAAGRGWRLIQAVVIAGGEVLRGVWAAVWGAATVATRAGMLAIEGTVAAGELAIRNTTAAAGGIAALWARIWAAVLAVTRGAWAAMVALSTAGGRAVAIVSATAGTGIAAAWRVVTGGMVAIWSRGWAIMKGISVAGSGNVIKSIGTGLIGGLRSIGGLLVRAFTGPWGIAIAAVIALVAMFHRQIAAMWHNVVAYFQSGGNGIAQAFAPVVRFFGSAIDWIKARFYSLPQAVQDVFTSIVNFIADAAKAVYGWLQWMNPFARHSPSLVESVTKGMAIVKNQYQSAAGIASVYAKAARDIEAFHNATSKLRVAGPASDTARHSQQQRKIARAAPGALPEFHTLVNDELLLKRYATATSAAIQAQSAVVKNWKTSLDNANRSLDAANDKMTNLQATATAASDNLDAAQARLQHFTDAPLRGMGALNNQIYANDEAQKKLQLQMMKMEDATGPLDDITTKLANIQGQIETLRGKEASLRSAGAGSDILNTYDQQIAGLKGQQSAIQASGSPIANLQAQLDALQRKGQELDLEKSLKLDPLQHALDGITNTAKELTFDEIINGAKAAQIQVTKYQIATDKANAAVKAQQAVIDALTKRRDAINKTYDTENSKLNTLKANYTSLKQHIQSIENALIDMARAAQDSITRANQSAAAAKRAAAADAAAAKRAAAARKAASKADAAHRKAVKEDQARMARIKQLQKVPRGETAAQRKVRLAELSRLEAAHKAANAPGGVLARTAAAAKAAHDTMSRTERERLAAHQRHLAALAAGPSKTELERQAAHQRALFRASHPSRSELERQAAHQRALARKAARAAGGGGAGVTPSPGAMNFEAAKGGNFPDVGNFARIGREGANATDQSKQIDALTKGLTDQLGQSFGALDMFKPLRDSWNKAWAWIKKTIGPIVSAIGGLFGAAFKGTGNPFAAISDFFTKNTAIKDAVRLIQLFLGWLRTLGKFLWGFFGPQLKATFGAIGTFFVDLWNAIFPQIKAFGPLLKPLGDALVNLFKIIGVAAAVVFAPLVAGIKILWGAVNGALGPILSFIVTFLKNLIRITRGLLQIFIGIFTLNFGMIWSGIKNVIGGLFSNIINAFKTLFLVVFGVIRGAIGAIVQIFQFMWKALHLDAAARAVGRFFSSMGGAVAGGLKAAFSAIVSFFSWIGRGVVLALRAVRMDWNVFASWLTSVWRGFAKIVSVIWRGLWWVIVHWFGAMWAVVKTIWRGVANFFMTVWRGWWRAVSALWKGIWWAIRHWFGWMWDGVKAAWAGIAAFFLRVWRGWGRIISSLWRSVWFSSIRHWFGVAIDAVKAAWRAVAGWFSRIWGSWSKWLSNLWHRVWHDGITHWFSVAWDKTKGVWNGIKTWFGTQFHNFGGWVKWIWGIIASAIPNALRNIRKGVSGAFTLIKTAATNGVNAVIGVINTLISGVNWIFKKLHLPFHIGAIQKLGGGGGGGQSSNGSGRTFGGGNQGPRRLARGGVLPGYTPGRDVHKFTSPTGGRLDLSGGEGVLVPETVRKLGGKKGIDALNAWGSSRVRNHQMKSRGSNNSAFLFGGVWSGIESAFKHVKDWGTTLLDKGADFMINMVTKPVRAAMSHVGGEGFVSQIGQGVVNTAIDAFRKLFVDKTKPLIQAASGGGNDLVAYARRFVGTPYVWGGAEPGGFDCSGLTSFVMHHFHIPSPRTAHEQQAWARGGAESNAAVRAGHLAFWGRPAHHVAFYSGNGKIIEAPDVGLKVREVAARTGGDFAGYERQPGIDRFATAGNFGPAGPVGPGAPSANRALGRKIALSRGLDWSGMDYIATHESGWRNTAQNPTSSAYGIFQFLNSTWGSYGGRKTSDPLEQINDFILYASDRYGGITQAANYWRAHHSYARGGVTNGPALVGEGRRTFPEFVIPTDPRYRNQAKSLYMQVGAALGAASSTHLGNHARLAKEAAVRGYRASAARSGNGPSGGITVVNHDEGTKNFHFHGDLSFPNIKSGADAERFLQNLENLASR